MALVGNLLVSSVFLLITYFSNEVRKKDEAKMFKGIKKELILPIPEVYDFIIVGGGTAGCILANRLSKNYSVLMLEAGGDPPPVQNVPALNYITKDAPEINFLYRSQPEKNAGRAFGGRIQISTGKMLGGSSSSGGMIWERGHPNDYNLWADLTRDESWKYENIEKYFKKIEKLVGQSKLKKSGNLTRSGPTRILRDTYAPGIKSWLAAGKELGYSISGPNVRQKFGFSPLAFTKKRGRRVSSFTAYLKPKMRKRRSKNLRIQRYSVVSEVIFEQEFYREARIHAHPFMPPFGQNNKKPGNNINGGSRPPNTGGGFWNKQNHHHHHHHPQHGGKPGHNQSGGSQNQYPPGGSNNQYPPGGSHHHKPSGGSQNQYPDNTKYPSGGSHHHKPQGGGHHQKPGGAHHHKPPGGPGNQNPQGGSQNQYPSGGHHNHGHHHHKPPNHHHPHGNYQQSDQGSSNSDSNRNMGNYPNQNSQPEGAYKKPSGSQHHFGHHKHPNFGNKNNPTTTQTNELGCTNPPTGPSVTDDNDWNWSEETGWSRPSTQQTSSTTDDWGWKSSTAAVSTTKGPSVTDDIDWNWSDEDGLKSSTTQKSTTTDGWGWKPTTTQQTSSTNYGWGSSTTDNDWDWSDENGWSSPTTQKISSSTSWGWKPSTTQKTHIWDKKTSTTQPTSSTSNGWGWESSTTQPTSSTSNGWGWEPSTTQPSTTGDGWGWTTTTDFNWDWSDENGWTKPTTTPKSSSTDGNGWTKPTTPGTTSTTKDDWDWEEGDETSPTTPSNGWTEKSTTTPATAPGNANSDLNELASSEEEIGNSQTSNGNDNGFGIDEDKKWQKLNSKNRKQARSGLKRAVGVKYTRHGLPQIAYASKEIILSAGTYVSPIILMKSGIGPAGTTAPNVEPIAELPVGRNLLDHSVVGVQVLLNKPKYSWNVWDNVTYSDLYEFLKNGSGPMTGSEYSAQAKLESTELLSINKAAKATDAEESKWPDLQIRYSYVAYDYGAVTCNVERTRPRSKGSVKLNSTATAMTDPNLPIIKFNYFFNEKDLNATISGINFCLKTFESTQTYEKLGAHFSALPYEPCKDFSFRSHEYWKCYVKSTAFSTSNSVGTCRMGFGSQDPKAVVDSKFRVIGVQGLRVVDASVMPYITNSNTMAPTMMIAEKASADILKEHRQLL